jgi:hypothetical protein
MEVIVSIASLWAVAVVFVRCSFVRSGIRFYACRT